MLATVSAPRVEFATEEHAASLLKAMPRAERRRYEAESGLSFKDGLTEGLVSSWPRAYAVVYEGETLAMFGCVRIPHPGVSTGYPWMACSPHARSRQFHRDWIKLTREWMPQLFHRGYPHQYDGLCGFVDANDEARIRYIRRMGFIMNKGNPKPTGSSGAKHIEFFIRWPKSQS